MGDKKDSLARPIEFPGEQMSPEAVEEMQAAIRKSTRSRPPAPIPGGLLHSPGEKAAFRAEEEVAKLKSEVKWMRKALIILADNSEMDEQTRKMLLHLIEVHTGVK